MQFVYKNCRQLAEFPNRADLQSTLSDALYSHCHHPSSGPAFELMFAVISHQPDDFVCPICLYPPVAPRMTKCGHIFCADCLNAHIVISERLLCPICYEHLGDCVFVRTDLRLYAKSDCFCFRKVVRSSNNCVCFDPTVQEKAVLPGASEPSAVFCRFAIADQDYVRRLVEQERRALEAQVEVYRPYHDALKDQFLGEIHDKVRTESVDYADDPHFMLQEWSARDELLFYQDAFGRLIFLDPLSNKMLSASFGGIDKAPPVLEVRALKGTSFTVDKRSHAHFECCRHLPVGAEVQFLLADLSSVVRPDVATQFAPRLEERLRKDEDIEGENDDNEQLSDADFPALSPLPPPARSPPAKTSSWAKVTAPPRPPPPAKSLSSEAEFPSFSTILAAGGARHWGRARGMRDGGQRGRRASSQNVGWKQNLGTFSRSSNATRSAQHCLRI
jgi:hypothetical protein